VLLPVGAGVDAEQQVGVVGVVAAAGEQHDAAVGVDERRRRVSGVRPGDPGDVVRALGWRLLDPGHHGGRGRADPQQLHRPVQPGQDRRRPLSGGGGDPAQQPRT
jgi:hypothetical protein